MLSLADISERTGLSPDDLRYVLDQELVPGMGEASRGRGRPREFTEKQAMAVAIAGFMIHSGMRRGAIDSLQLALAATKWIEDIESLEQQVVKGRHLVFEWADGIYWRGRSVAPDATTPDSTRWMDARRGRFADSSFVPVWVSALCVSELWRRLRKAN